MKSWATSFVYAALFLQGAVRANFWDESIVKTSILVYHHWFVSRDLFGKTWTWKLFFAFSTIGEAHLYRLIGFWKWHRSSDGRKMHISQADKEKLDKGLLGGGFRYFWNFQEMIQFDLHRFQMGWFNHQLVWSKSHPGGDEPASWGGGGTPHGGPRADRYKWLKING